MMIVISTIRSHALAATRSATLAAAMMLCLSAFSAVRSQDGVAQAAAIGGKLQVVVPPDSPTAGQPLGGGGSATPFTLLLPTAATCTGDSAVGGYLVQSYMVPAAVDPASLTFNNDGPLPAGVGAAFRQPLFSGGSAFINRNTGLETTAGSGGLILTIPAFSFALFGVEGPNIVPNGKYNIGIACSRGLPSATQLDKYWNTQIEVTADPTDDPAGLKWVTVEDETSTTTTTTTTTVADSTTTTTVSGGTTTTTVARATTTTTTLPASTSGTVTPASPAPGGAYTVTYSNCEVGETITFSQTASTPASVTSVCAASAALADRNAQALTAGTATGRFTAAPTAAGSYTVTMTGTVSAQRASTFVIATASTPVSGGGSSSGSGGSTFGTSGGTIPSTGSSTTSMIVWGVLMLVFGRMAILLGRKPKVVPASR